MMEDRIKQRLTGAAIVVALLVLLVPEMFRGRPAPPAPPAGAAPAGPPVRSYTIDLAEHGAASTAGSGTANGAATGSLPAVPAAEPAAPAGAVPASGGAPASPGAASAPAPASPPEGAAAPARAPESTTAPAPSAAPSPDGAAAPSAGSPPAASAAAGRFQVQLGLFASRENAERLAAGAVKKGVKVVVSGPDARGLYRVHTPGSATREQAEATQLKLRELGLTAAVTPAR